MAYVGSFAAVGHPTRQKLIERLRQRPHAVGELARHLEVSQPAVSQHLAVLRKARLVRSRRDGQRRLYELDPEGIAALREHVEAMWSDAMAAYARSFKE